MYRYGNSGACDRRIAEMQSDLDTERYERERLEGQIREMEHRQYAEQRERREEREREVYYEYRTASDWPEALRKQASLFESESWLDDPADGRMMFGDAARTCERALTIWREEEAKTAEQTAALRAQISALRDGIRLAVADRLEAEGGEKSVIGALREYSEDSGDLSAWLQW